jgi:hypothetical protein
MPGDERDGDEGAQELWSEVMSCYHFREYTDVLSQSYVTKKFCGVGRLVAVLDDPEATGPGGRFGSRASTSN